MEARVLVLGYANDVQVAHQMECLTSLGATPSLIEPEISLRDPISWLDHEPVFGSERAASFHALLARSTPSDVLPPGAFAGGAMTWAEWFQASCLHQCAFDAWVGMLTAMSRDGVPMFNAPSAMLASRRKPAQLDVLRRAGCPIPRTLITNDPDRARSFIAETGDCIVKPVIGGALTLSANELPPERLAALTTAPAIFQQRIFGDDLRVMVLDGEVISSVAIQVPPGTIDFRGDDDYASGRATYQEAPLPEPIARACGRATEMLGLRFAGIDVKRTPAGEHVLLEVNSSPIYLDVEEKMGHPITERLCRRLLEAAGGRRYRTPRSTRTASV